MAFVIGNHADIKARTVELVASFCVVSAGNLNHNRNCKDEVKAQQCGKGTVESLISACTRSIKKKFLKKFFNARHFVSFTDIVFTVH